MHEPWRHPSPFRVREAMAAPTGRRTAPGSWQPASDVQGPGLFMIPVDGRAPVRLVSGQVVNPVWSPDGALIVYGGPVVGGRVPLLGVKPDGTRVELPDVRTRLGGGHRFLPNGTGLVYLPRSQSRDFWLLDLATKKTRQLTRLGDHGDGPARSTSRPMARQSSSTVCVRTRISSSSICRSNARIIAHPYQPTTWRRDTR